MNPIQAVTHENPYPYYASLRTGPPLLRDAELGLWIASSAEAVAEVLASPDFLVRPRNEHTPRAITGTAAGDVFARLVRMNDGASHWRWKQVLTHALAGIDAALAARTAAQIAKREWRDGIETWNDWIYRVPLCSVAALLGFAEDDQRRVAGLARSFVACLSPLSEKKELASASEAADALRLMLAAMLDGPISIPGGLLDAVVREAKQAGCDDRDALIANLVGLFSQTCDATAGWTGNCMAVLMSQPEALQSLLLRPALLDAFVDEVGRFDPAVQNTRRFAARRLRFGSAVLEEGECVLVVLAAANRDPCANVDPDAFLIERRDRKSFGFGHGVHRCPGQALARAMTAGAVQGFLRAAPPCEDRARWAYRKSANSRIPMFQDIEEN